MKGRYKLKRAVRLILLISSTVFLFSSACLAETPTGKEILKGLNVQDAEIKSLENGEVLTKLASEYEL